VLKGQVKPVRDYTEQEVERMYSLMTEFYDDTDKTVFLKDFYDKDYCLTLYHETDGLVGFTTQKVLSVTVNGKTVHGMFSGDTIIHKQHWGSIELFRVWANFWFPYAQQYDEFYWFLICKGYKTYRILPVFWTEFYPTYKAPTPAYEQAIIDAYASYLYPDEYDKNTGVIQYKTVKDKLKKGVADIGESQLKNKDVAFFQQKNPTHINGDDLACLAKIDTSVIKKRILGLMFE
jgi:hypothetical protein